MARVLKIPITPMFANVDDVENTTASPFVVNGIVTDGESLVKRPGLTAGTDLGTSKPVEGLYWWEFDQSVIAVSDGRVWRITAPDWTKAEITGEALADNATTGGKRRVEFAEMTSGGTGYVFAANGKAIYYPNGSSQTEQLVTADADAPSQVRFLTAHDGYILAIDDSTPGKVMFSGVGAPLSWNALDYFMLESKPDDVMNIKSMWRELFLPGSDSIEVWYNDGSTPFARLDGAYTEDGVLASYSLVHVDGNWVYLNRDRQLVALAGRTPKVISKPIDKYLQNLQLLSTAWAEVVKIRGRYLYVLHVPDEAPYALVCDLGRIGNPLGGWGLWAKWDGSTYQTWNVRPYCYARDWKYHLWGGVDGKIYLMDEDYTNDGNAANPVRVLYRTGHLDHGAFNQKRCLRLRLKLQRGVATGGVPSPVLKVYWRDNKTTTLNGPISVDLGASTDKYILRDLYNLGIYHTRQWEFVQDQDVEFTLIDAEETVEDLAR